MNSLREAFGIARKEIMIDFRFPIEFILHSIASPVAHLIPILLVYTAILGGDQESPIEGIDGTIYIPFLIIGILFQSIWSSGTSVFRDKFLRDKHLQTVDLLFIAPIRTLAIIAGYGGSVVIRMTPLILTFLVLAIIAFPPPIHGLLLAIIAFMFVFSIALGIGLIYGSATLATEDIGPIFSYAITGIALVTIFFYPIEIFSRLPGILGIIVPKIALANPINAGLQFARSAWLGDPIPWASLAYLAISAIVIVTVSLWVFRYTWRRFGVQG